MDAKITITDETPYELASLTKGEPVALRYSPTGHTIFLTPGPVYGLSDSALIIAGLGAKCTVMDIRDITLTPLIQAGLVAPAAQTLKRELERTYHHAYHQIPTQPKARRARRKAKSQQSDNGRSRPKANRRRTAKSPGKGRQASSAT